ncbi:MAG: rRNA maturation RNase YbeY [Sedimenticola sp.]|nr:rRNA maturation RNase YbeY [Sedimenticola sp.]
MQLEIQRVIEVPDLPPTLQFQTWVEAALQGRRDEAELVIRIVDREESRSLNSQYRGKDRPTNVLSFASELPPEVESGLLGDLVICAPLVAEEARAQGKILQEHWAHLVVHGVLHLLGYDHQHEQEAEEMEGLEAGILARQGISDPYQSERES